MKCMAARNNHLGDSYRGWEYLIDPGILPVVDTCPIHP